MRGKGTSQGGTGGQPGITPAYAGKSCSASQYQRTPRDHPRTCGEKGSSLLEAMPLAGSPPHMRGKVPPLLVACLSLGITPAYAGKSHKHAVRRPVHGDHPRICGEKSVLNLNPHQQQGSPPHMRGKGKSGFSSWSRLDHPRICGEKAQVEADRPNVQGSPPHMRGKASTIPKSRSLSGITPAYAGKSYQTDNGDEKDPDHPRICGEKGFPLGPDGSPLGSPPHMRGKADTPSRLEMSVGITPAYAGKRYRKDRTSFAEWDHPRICGEKHKRNYYRLNVTGSPPHMRGKAGVGRTFGSLSGITPAYAGKSLARAIIPDIRADHPRICGEKSL